MLLFHTSIKGLFSLLNHRLGFRLPGGDRGIRFLLLLEHFKENTLVCQSFRLLFFLNCARWDPGREEVKFPPWLGNTVASMERGGIPTDEPPLRFFPWMKRRIDRGSVWLPLRAWRPRRATTAAARAAARAKPRRGRERERAEGQGGRGKKVMEKLHLWSCVRIGERTGQKTKVSDLNWQTPEPGWNNVSARTGAVQRQLCSDRSPQLNFEPRWILSVFFYALFFFFA